MLILKFEHFHPLTGKYPNTFPEFGSDIVYRAREILQGKGLNELKETIKIINWLIDQSPAQDDSINQLEIDVGIIEEQIENGRINCAEKAKRDLYSMTYALRRCQSKFKLEDIFELTEPSWSDLFAVLALSLIDQAIEKEKYYGGWAHDDVDWLYEWRILSHSAYWLIEAMDAVATAEGLRDKDSSINEIKNKISIRNRAAAIQKHSKTNEALLVIKDFYLSGNFKSMRNAVQIFCERNPELVSHLAFHNRLRTLSEGLSKLLSNNRLSISNPE